MRFKRKSIYNHVFALIAVLCGITALITFDMLKPPPWPPSANYWELQHSPFFLQNDRLLFLQPDYTLTVLDVNTGKVLGRDVAIRNNDDFWESLKSRFSDTKWQLEGDVAVTCREYGIFIIDMKEGKVRQDYLGYDCVQNDVLLYDKGLFFKDRNRLSLVMVDVETFTEKTLCRFLRGSYDVMNERLFVWSKTDSQELKCFDLKSGSLIWMKSLPRRIDSLGMICRDGMAMVFGSSPKARSFGKDVARTGRIHIDRLLAYDEKGNLIDAQRIDADDFGGEWPASSQEFTFRGREYSVRERFTKFAAARADAENQDAPRTSINSTPPDVEISRHYDPVSSGGKAWYGITFDDGNDSWRGRIKSMDSWPAFISDLPWAFRLATTDRYVILGTPNGKVECLDRNTGRSLWLYSYPILDFVQWSRDSFLTFSSAYRTSGWQPYFLAEDWERYRKSLSIADQTGVTVDGEIANPSITVDPAPIPLEGKRNVVILGWIVVGIVLAACAIGIARTGKRDPATAFNCVTMALFALLFAFSLLSRYSRAMTLPMVAAIVIALGLYHWLKGDLKPYEKAECFESPGSRGILTIDAAHEHATPPLKETQP